jgi:hypothetical protein
MPSYAACSVRSMKDPTRIPASSRSAFILIDGWPAIAPRSARTAERYEEHIEKHTKPTIGGLILSKLTNLDVSAFYAAKLASGRLDGTGGLAARTVHQFDRLLHLAFEDAVRSGLIVFNPVTHAKRPKVAKTT